MAGAFKSYEKGGGNKGVKSDISCACHWAVNQASAQKIGTMWGKSYVVTPGGIMVPPEFADHDAGTTRRAGDRGRLSLRQPFHHVQSLEPYPAADQIKLRFGGSIWARVDIAVGRDLPAVSVWGLTFQVLEQLGFRKVVDTSFMIAFMFPDGVDPADVEKYMNGMKRAQMDLDFAPEKYRHYYLNEIPERYKAKVDVRRFSTGRAHRVPALYGGDVRADAGLDRRTRHFRRTAAAVDYAASVAA